LSWLGVLARLLWRLLGRLNLDVEEREACCWGSEQVCGYRCMGISDVTDSQAVEMGTLLIWEMKEAWGAAWVDVSVSVQRDGTDAFACLPIVRAWSIVMMCGDPGYSTIEYNTLSSSFPVAGSFGRGCGDGVISWAWLVSFRATNFQIPDMALWMTAVCESQDARFAPIRAHICASKTLGTAPLELPSRGRRAGELRSWSQA
jgi:hypothetical protein